MAFEVMFTIVTMLSFNWLTKEHSRAGYSQQAQD